MAMSKWHVACQNGMMHCMLNIKMAYCMECWHEFDAILNRNQSTVIVMQNILCAYFTSYCSIGSASPWFGYTLYTYTRFQYIVYIMF